MSEKFAPNFLNPEMKVGPLRNDEYGYGSFVDVGNIENLPENVKEKAIHGYVIKKYRLSNNPITMASMLFVDGSEERKNGLSIEGIAKELKHRNSIMKNYFAESMPELVVPTQVIIGKDEKTNKKTIYEIQSRLDEPNTASKAGDPSLEPLYKFYLQGDESEKSKAEEVLDNFIAYIKVAFPEKIDLLKHEISIFRREIRKMYATGDYLPYDCAKLNNLIFTRNGLRLVDSNAVVPVPPEEPSLASAGVNKRLKDDLAWRWNMFQGSLAVLKLIESKL